MNSISSKAPILIAEDDQDDQFMLKEALKPFENLLDVYFVEDGEKLIKFLRGGDGRSEFPQPKLILLDIQMPKKDGREALMEIKNDERLKHIPVVVWTTSEMEDERRFCIEAGAEDYVTKPHNFGELELAVQHIIRTWLRLPPGK